MENPFLCESCRPFGYCRKHHQVASEKVMAEFAEAFYQRVKTVSYEQSKLQIPRSNEFSTKLTSLEKIRSLYRVTPSPIAMTQQEKEKFIERVLAGSVIEQTATTSDLLETCCF